MRHVYPSTDMQPQPKTSAIHKNTAKMCARYLTHVFRCPPYDRLLNSTQDLQGFVEDAFRRSRLHESVAYHALYLLSRLEATFPLSRCGSGHLLFASAYMISAKVMVDEAYSNKSWVIVYRKLIPLSLLNQAERVMCRILDWQLIVQAESLAAFTNKIRQDSRGNGPYPEYFEHPPLLPVDLSEYSLFWVQGSNSVLQGMPMSHWAFDSHHNTSNTAPDYPSPYASLLPHKVSSAKAADSSAKGRRIFRSQGGVVPVKTSDPLTGTRIPVLPESPGFRLHLDGTGADCGSSMHSGPRSFMESVSTISTSSTLRKRKPRIYASSSRADSEATLVGVERCVMVS